MNNINIPIKVKGQVRVRVVDSLTGGTRFDSGVFDNMLLNNLFSSNDNYIELDRCYAGTDSEVDPTDTTINSLGSTTNKSVETLPVEFDGSVVTAKMKRVFTFGAGAISGNLSSIGLGTTGSTLFIKTLIKDISGNPTTITLSAEDQLIIEHTISHVTDSFPAASIINIDGVDHTFQLIASDYTLATNGFASFAPFYPTNSGTDVNNSKIHIAESATVPPLGTIGSYISLTNSLSQTAAYATQPNTPAVGSRSNKFWITMAANTVLGASAPIGFIGLSWAGGPKVGFTISPSLPKDNTIAYTFTVTFTMSR